MTFGVETALSGTYESLLHHALEIAAVEHPQLFGLPPSQGETKTETEAAAVSAAFGWLVGWCRLSTSMCYRLCIGMICMLFR